MFVDRNTPVEGEIIYREQKTKPLGVGDSLKSLIHLVLMVFSGSINLSWRKTLICTEVVIKPGVDIMVKGLLKQNNNKLYIRPDFLSVNTDSTLIRARRSLSVSLKFTLFFGILWASANLYKQAKAGLIKIFSKEKEAEIAESNECIICLTHRRNIIINPCKHIAICNKCSDIAKCPICRIDIQRLDLIGFLE